VTNKPSDVIAEAIIAQAEWIRAFRLFKEDTPILLILTDGNNWKFYNILFSVPRTIVTYLPKSSNCGLPSGVLILDAECDLGYFDRQMYFMETLAEILIRGYLQSIQNRIQLATQIPETWNRPQIVIASWVQAASKGEVAVQELEQTRIL
jgi:hypothetical protein